MLTDEAFLVAYAHEVGALAHRVDVEGAADARTDRSRTRVAMTVATTGVPAALKRLVTPTVDITEVRTWVGSCRRPLAGSACGGRVGPRRDARVRGSALSSPERTADAASRFGVDGKVSVGVPLLGDLAAGLVRDLVGSVIKRQSAVMDRWLRDA